MGIFSKLLAKLANGADPIDEMTRVKRAYFIYDGLPDSIPRKEPDVFEPTVPVADATVDQIAFAILEADREFSAASSRVSSLKRLHTVAREQGCIGSDCAVNALAAKLEGNP